METPPWVPFLAECRMDSVLEVQGVSVFASNADQVWVAAPCWLHWMDLRDPPEGILFGIGDRGIQGDTCLLP